MFLSLHVAILDCLNILRQRIILLFYFLYRLFLLLFRIIFMFENLSILFSLLCFSLGDVVVVKLIFNRVLLWLNIIHERLICKHILNRIFILIIELIWSVCKLKYRSIQLGLYTTLRYIIYNILNKLLLVIMILLALQILMLFQIVALLTKRHKRFAICV